MKNFWKVTHETNGGGASNLEEFLDKQKDIWSKFWDPSSPDLKYRLAEKFKHLRFSAQEQNENNKVIFDSDTLDTILKGYKKETIGCDVWKPSDLRRLPQRAKSDLSHHICN